MVQTSANMVDQLNRLQAEAYKDLYGRSCRSRRPKRAANSCCESVRMRKKKQQTRYITLRESHTEIRTHEHRCKVVQQIYLHPQGRKQSSTMFIMVTMNFTKHLIDLMNNKKYIKKKKNKNSLFYSFLSFLCPNSLSFSENGIHFILYLCVFDILLCSNSQSGILSP